MRSFRASLSELSGPRRAFVVVVLITLGLIGFFGLVVLEPELFARLLGRQTAGHISHHFREHQHRIHDFTFSFLLGTAVIGLLAQLRAPLKNVASQLMALTPFVGLMLAVLLTNPAVLSIPWIVAGTSTVVATLLHPAGRELFASFRNAGVNRLMLALVFVAAVPLLALAITNIGLQRTPTNDHAALGHYGFMAGFSFAVIGVGLLASMRPAGWRLAAWIAGLLPALLGFASVVFPDVESSLSLAWSLGAIAWGVTFLAVAEFVRVRGPRAAEHTPTANLTPSATGTAGWRYGFAIILAALVLVFVIQHLAGGAFGRHM